MRENQPYLGLDTRHHRTLRDPPMTRAWREQGFFGLASVWETGRHVGEADVSWQRRVGRKRDSGATWRLESNSRLVSRAVIPPTTSLTPVRVDFQEIIC